MTQGGFFDRKTNSPAGLALVIALHAAALGAVALIKGPDIVRPFFPRTKVEFIALPKDPPPEPQPEVQRQVELPPTRIERVDPVVETRINRPVVAHVDPPPPLPPLADAGAGRVPETRIEPPPPVRTAAEFDSRYAEALRPPYPASEQRAQRGGSVTVRVTIGADGRVKAIERVSATSDAFWRATERHALARWRFRPATIDGRPVESSKTMTLRFRIEDA